jgi:hypothetical protein
MALQGRTSYIPDDDDDDDLSVYTESVGTVDTLQDILQRFTIECNPECVIKLRSRCETAATIPQEALSFSTRRLPAPASFRASVCGHDPEL